MYIKSRTYGIFAVLLLLFCLGNVKAQDSSRYDMIYFDSPQMMQTAWLGQVFSCQFKAHTMSNDEIRYEFANEKFPVEQIPQGMTLDTITGIVSWTPDKEGDYMVNVRAYLLNNKNMYAEANFILVVRDSSKYIPCATITGTVKYKNNDMPASNITVSAIPIDNNDFNLFVPFQAQTDADGKYTLNVSKGDFYLATDDMMTGHIYYSDSNSREPKVVSVKCGDNLAIDISIYNEKQRDYIYFQNYPNKTFLSLENNDKFEFDADAQSLYGGDTILYKLITAPAGATVDNTTGLVEWTPVSEGNFEFVLRAYLQNDETKYADLEWTVYVGQKDPNKLCAYIKGTIQDKDGNPVTRAFVSIMSSDTTYMFIGFGYFAETDDQGQFMVNVPEGTFILYTGGGDFEPLFYKDAVNPQDATPISVKCNDTANITMTVTKYPPPVLHTVTGMVTDANTGVGIKAYVEFFPTTRIFGDSIYGRGTYPPFNTSVETDDNGNYSIQLPESIKFKAMAYTMDGKYMPQYYDSKNDWTEATEFELTGDMNGVNFALQPYKVYNNGFAGKVVDADGNGIDACIAAFSSDKNNPPMGGFVFSAITDSVNKGTFRIDNLIPGTYYVFAAPLTEKFMPGYYKENDFAVMDWNEATPLDIKDNEFYGTNIQIKLDKLILTFGPGRLDGWVVKKGGIAKSSNDKPQAGNQVEGALVALYNNNKKCVGWTFSDNDGKYSIENFDAGSYTLKAGKFGYDIYNSTVNFDTKDNLQNSQEIPLANSKPLAVNDGLNNLFCMYPNPATDLLTLELGNLNGNVQINILNVLGMTISSYNVVVGDLGIININTSNLNPGTYIIRIKNDNKVQSGVIEIVR